MKRIIIVLIFLASLLVMPKLYADSSYLTFQELTVLNGKLMRKWTDSEYKEFLKKVEKRKFYGWNIYYVQKEAKCTFISETLATYYNDGYTPIEYKYQKDITAKVKYDISVQGTLKLTADVKYTGVKGLTLGGGLSSEIKASFNYEKVVTETEKVDFSFKVDPGTIVNMYYTGEGKITNGTAASYLFWITLYKGSFEIFVETTHYFRMEKRQI